MVYVYIGDNGIKHIASSANGMSVLVGLTANHIRRVVSGGSVYRGRGYILVRFDSIPKQGIRNRGGNPYFKLLRR